MTTNIKHFEIGKKYSMRSICDYDCVWSYVVIARTNSTITLKDERGNVKKCRINKRSSEYFKAEACSPLGVYSMSPTLVAR